MSCGVGCRCGSDLVWLWLWCRPAAAAPIYLPAHELPYATDVAVKRKEKKKKELKKQFLQATALALPDLATPSDLDIHERRGLTLGVLNLRFLLGWWLISLNSQI